MSESGASLVAPTTGGRCRRAVLARHGNSDPVKIDCVCTEEVALRARRGSLEESWALTAVSVGHAATCLYTGRPVSLHEPLLREF